MAHRRLELVERQIGFAVAVLPVAAHLAARIAHPRAVVDEHGRPDRMKGRRDERVGEIARDAGRGPGDVAQPEAFGGHYWLLAAGCWLLVVGNALRSQL